MATKISQDDFSDLPRWVEDYSEDQRDRVVTFLSSKPLAELRKRQGIICSQIESASHLPDVKREKVVADLQGMFDMECEAIRQQFA